MTINDMIEQGIVIQGKVELRQWKDGEQTDFFKHSDFESSNTKNRSQRENKMLDLEVDYMFCVDNTLVFELKEKE